MELTLTKFLIGCVVIGSFFAALAYIAEKLEKKGIL